VWEWVTDRDSSIIENKDMVERVVEVEYCWLKWMKKGSDVWLVWPVTEQNGSEE
jgi:hypothetical protein